MCTIPLLIVLLTVLRMAHVAFSGISRSTGLRILKCSRVDSSETHKPISVRDSHLQGAGSVGGGSSHPGHNRSHWFEHPGGCQQSPWRQRSSELLMFLVVCFLSFNTKIIIIFPVTLPSLSCTFPFTFVYVEQHSEPCALRAPLQKSNEITAG